MPVEERAQTASLLELFGPLATACTPDEVASAMVGHAPAVFGAVGVVLTRVVEPGSDLEIMDVGDMPDNLREQWRTIPIDAPVPLADVARTREPIFLSSREAWMQRYPHLTLTVEATRHHANAVLPLVVDTRLVGVLGLAFEQSREFDDDERSLLLTLASQCALVLDRARLYEAERAARRDAELANRAKSDFLAMMSHELRTPLNAIGGYAELIELGVHGPVNAEQSKSLERIRDSQRHVLGLINTVLDYARGASHAIHYEMGDVPVDDLMSNAESFALPQARARRIELRRATCDADLVAHADRAKALQILINLLGNAVKFTAPEGQVALLAERGGADTIAIRVSDTGFGLAADQLERIFQPFVQVEWSPGRAQQGTGLGLAISRDLARGMNGDVTVESTPGAGSTFTLWLPATTRRPR
jgi:signal transduction histidine kinase